MKYSLIVPYYRTPEITRLALHSMFHFAMGEPEVIVVDNAPGGEESRMLDEFPKIRRLDNATALRGSDANFEALDIGLAAASHDLVGLVHSDSIFMRVGWDRVWFDYLDSQNLAALGTFEREANPFRPWRKRVEDRFKHMVHRRRVEPGLPGKLAMHFLLTRRTDLAAAGFSFRRDRDLLSRQFDGIRNGVEVLSLREISGLMWHTSNITSLLTGQMNEPRLIRSYKLKRRRFLEDPFVQKHFAGVLPRVTAGPTAAGQRS
jgi:hypothetical protein